MKFTVENLGAVKKATIDLSKDLLVFTGENNSGKTYLAYSVYTLTKGKMLLRMSFENNEIFLKENKELIFDIHKKGLENEIVNSLKYRIKADFATDDNFFSKTKFKIDFLDEKELKAIFLREVPNVLLKIVIIDKILVTKTILFPSMREGISLFHKELALIKSKALDEFNNPSHAENWEKVIKRINRFPAPIKESLEFAQNLDDIKKDKSDFAFLADELENSFLNGKIQINQDGNLEFKMKNKEVLEFHMTSSTVKSLSYLIVYLRHLAQKGDFIIIDEPELNLHPDNQRKLAKFFGRLINEGFKLLISTHSDYIVRELNNLIMLKEGTIAKNKETNKLLKKYNYTENQLINKDQVGVYLFRQGVEVENIEISETGFNVPTIDDEIKKLNQTTNDIIFNLFE